MSLLNAVKSEQKKKKKTEHVANLSIFLHFQLKWSQASFSHSILWQRTMASDIEVLMHIPATSQTTPQCAWGHGRRKPAKPCQLTGVQTHQQFLSSQTRHSSPHSCASRSCPWISQTGLRPRDSPGGVQHLYGHRFKYRLDSLQKEARYSMLLQ